MSNTVARLSIRRKVYVLSCHHYSRSYASPLVSLNREQLAHSLPKIGLIELILIETIIGITRPLLNISNNVISSVEEQALDLKLSMEVVEITYQDIGAACYQFLFQMVKSKREKVEEKYAYGLLEEESLSSFVMTCTL